MTVTPRLFEAFLSCQTKCWLRATNEASTGNAYAQWSAARGERYRTDEVKRLVADRRDCECLVAPAAATMKSAAWLLAADVPAHAAGIETRIAAIERVPSARRDVAYSTTLAVRADVVRGLAGGAAAPDTAVAIASQSIEPVQPLRGRTQ
jgi:hypothetical protein